MSAFRAFFMFTLVLVGPVPARAFVKPYFKQTLGSGQYYGTTASIDAGGNFHGKPQFSTYHSNRSSGTYSTLSVRGEYDWDRYGIALTAGFTPTVNNYNSHSLGGDVSVTYDFDPPPADSETVVGVGASAAAVPTAHRAGAKPESEHPLIRSLDLGAGVTQTYHREIVAIPAVTAGVATVPASRNTKSIGQTDFEGSAALTIVDYVASLDVTKSTYDQDLARLAVKSAAVTHLAGLVSTTEGFPDLNAVARVELDGGFVEPYVSYTYTHYKVIQPISVAYTFGARADWRAFYLDASYERFAQQGAADINYYSLAAKFRF